MGGRWHGLRTCVAPDTGAAQQHGVASYFARLSMDRLVREQRQRTVRAYYRTNGGPEGLVLPETLVRKAPSVNLTPASTRVSARMKAYPFRAVSRPITCPAPLSSSSSSSISLQAAAAVICCPQIECTCVHNTFSRNLVQNGTAGEMPPAAEWHRQPVLESLLG